MADKAASVLAKLRNKAKASGISYQQCLQLFMQEEFLRKLSKSGYDDFLVLKGGLFIYTLTNFESRATIDVDFLLRGYSNSIDNVKDLIYKIISVVLTAIALFVGYGVYILVIVNLFASLAVTLMLIVPMPRKGNHLQ